MAVEPVKRWWQLILIVLGIGIFVVVGWQAGTDGLKAVFAGDWRFLLLATLATGVAQMISAWRLQVALGVATLADDDPRPASVRWPWRATYHVTMTAQIVGMVVPRLLSAIGGKAVALKAYDTDLRDSMPAVLIDNIFDILVMFPLMLPGFLFASGRLSQSGLVLSYGLIIGLLLAFVSWAPAGSWWLPRLSWLSRLPWIGRQITGFMERLFAVWPRGRHGRALLILTTLLNGLLAVRFYYIALALGLEVNLLLFVAIFPIAQLSLIIAVAPGGLGVFDLSWVGLLKLTEVANAESFAVAQRIYVTVINLFWGGFAMLLALTLVRPPVIEELP